MVKLKNYNVVLKHFVLLLTFITVISCAEKKYVVTKIEGKEIGITDKNYEVAELESFIKPYRDRIDEDLNKVLANAPETLDKSGQWQTSMGNFLADITFETADKVFYMREKKSLDICLLNHGGIRSIIPKGNVTARTAYEVMPFENTAIVIALKGEQILEIVNYILSEKKPHPLKGLTFTIDKNNQPKDILVKGSPVDSNKIYYVVTSDYLSNGGDNMLFFKKGVAQYDLEYKLRNIIIDYFKENKTITANKDIRITKE
ncbi:5'-nucleotidase [Flavobacterium sp.]|uniref:5'-nucleotidase C-terminal domain-containing protein n=1 Tax=Flavobacterium sp. TaxID=239 RepID=UPI002488A494|nr:5'-nucleotidase [Flavobacterium sp.]MDI1316954.1 5'-nucleotidase [Flavobacterium sp.]